MSGCVHFKNSIAHPAYEPLKPKSGSSRGTKAANSASATQKVNRLFTVTENVAPERRTAPCLPNFNAWRFHPREAPTPPPRTWCDHDIWRPAQVEIAGSRSHPKRAGSPARGRRRCPRRTARNGQPAARRSDAPHEATVEPGAQAGPEAYAPRRPAPNAASPAPTPITPPQLPPSSSRKRCSKSPHGNGCSIAYAARGNSSAVLEPTPTAPPVAANAPAAAAPAVTAAVDAPAPAAAAEPAPTVDPVSPPAAPTSIPMPNLTGLEEQLRAITGKID